MKGSQTISAILGDRWFINPAYAYAHLEYVTALVEGKIPVLQQGQGIPPKAVDIASRQNVGVLNITGPVFKYDGACGEPGYLSYGEQLQQLWLDESVKTIVINMDCPGGQGAGLRTLALMVRNSPKPVIGYVNDGMCCSAAYWILSQCSWIVASQPTDRIGSIGAYMLLLNFLKASENNGQPLVEVYSSLSTEKNLSVRLALAGKPELLQAELDEAVEVFIEDVQFGRGDRINLDVADPFKGGDYPAQSKTGIDALSIGLIDEMGTIDLAFDRAVEITNNPNFLNMSLKVTKLPNLVGKTVAQVPQTSLDEINAEFTASGITEFGVYPESVITEASATTTQLATTKTELTAANTKITDLQGQVVAAGTKFDGLQTTATVVAGKVTELTSQLATANARIEELENKEPAGGNGGKKVKSKGDSSPVLTRELYSWEKKALALGR